MLEIKTEVIPGTEGVSDDGGNGFSFTHEYRFRVNGILDENSKQGAINGSSSFSDERVIKILLTHSSDELIKEYLYRFHFYKKVTWWEYGVSVEIDSNKTYSNNSSPTIKIKLNVPKFEDWKKPWSLNELAEQLELFIQNHGDDSLGYFREDFWGIGIGISYKHNLEVPIETELGYLLSFGENAINDITEELKFIGASQSLITYFKLPDNYIVPFTQYLVYFQQFLSDLGIDVSSDIKYQSNKLLLKIIPLNEDQNLNDIANLLTKFISTAESNNLDIVFNDFKDISAVQWKHVIKNMQTEIKFLTQLLEQKSAIIENKNSSIELLELTNLQYKQLIKTSKISQEKEDVIPNILSVKKFDGKFFSINLPELLRMLKRKIKN